LDRIGHVPDGAAIKAILKQASSCGIRGLYTLSDSRILGVLSRWDARQRLPEIYPVIPNVLGYVREAADYGLIGAGFRRLSYLSLWRLFVLGMHSARHALAVLSRDFASMLDVLFEIEMATFKQFRPQVAFLHGQITDLALAIGNPRILTLFAERMRRRYNVEPALATYNLGTLLPRLSDWKIDIRIVHTPVHPSGFLMYPSPHVCEQLCQTASIHIISELLPPHGVPDENTFLYLRRHHIQSASFNVTRPDEIQPVVQAFVGAQSMRCDE